MCKIITHFIMTHFHYPFCIETIIIMEFIILSGDKECFKVQESKVKSLDILTFSEIQHFSAMYLLLANISSDCIDV